MMQVGVMALKFINLFSYQKENSWMKLMDFTKLQSNTPGRTHLNKA